METLFASAWVAVRLADWSLSSILKGRKTVSNIYVYIYSHIYMDMCTSMYLLKEIYLPVFLNFHLRTYAISRILVL